MSELLAEARVLVTPDTAAFRQLLVTQLAAIERTLPPIPVSVAPVVTGAAGVAGASAAQAELAASAVASTGAINAETQALSRQTPALSANAAAQAADAEAVAGATVARERAAASTVAYTRRLKGLETGAASSALSLAGLRGATLAASAPFLVGAAGAIAFGKSLGIATSFNSEIAVLGAVTGATAEDMERASQAAKDFGRDITLPGVSAGDAAQTITEFSKAGLSLEESIAATRGGLQLATAANISYQASVELAASALNAFNLSGDQAVHVADVLANASNLAQGSISDTALALRQAASAASVVGVSFEDTTALLTLLARNGIIGSDAGTALRTAFLRLVNPSKQAQTILKDLNVQLRDINGNVRPEIFQEFIAAQRNLSVAQQQSNAAIVFGVDAFRAFGAIAQEAPGALDEVRTGLDKTGTAAKITQARMTGLSGASQNLKNQLENLGLVAGETTAPLVTALANALADFVQDGTDAIIVVRDLAGELKGLVPPAPAGSEGPLGFLEDIGEFAVKTNIFEVVKILGDQIQGAKNEVADQSADFATGLHAAGLAAARGVTQFGTDISGAFSPAFEEINAAIRDGARKLRAAQIAAVSAATGRQAGLEEVFNQIVAGGGSQQDQIANLRRQAAQQAAIIAKAGPDAAGVQLQARRDAQAKLAQINQQIVGIEKAIAADRQSARDEADRIAEEEREADRAFLERQGDVRARQERLVGLAEETEGLQDDIKRRQGLRTLITQQIAAIRQSSLDAKTKTAAIKVLVAAKQSTSDEINKLVRTTAQQNREQREAAQEEREAADIALAESILDLTGNKNPLLRALDAAIRDAIRERNAAKKGSLAFKAAQTEINQLLLRKKEINKELEQEAQDAGGVGGTSLVDLFKRAQDITAGAGNVGFDTAGLRNLSAIPRIQTEVQQRLDIVNDPAAQAQRDTTDAIGRLINSIDRLNENLTTGNASTAGPTGGGGTRNAWKTLTEEQRFALQKQAQLMVQNGLVGGSR